MGIGNIRESDLEASLKPELLFSIQIAQGCFTGFLVLIIFSLSSFHDALPILPTQIITYLIYFTWFLAVTSYSSAFKLYDGQLNYEKAQSLSDTEVQKYGLDPKNPAARYVILVCRVPVMRSIILEPCSVIGIFVFWLGVNAKCPHGILLWSALIPIAGQVLIALKTFPSASRIKETFSRYVQPSL